MALIQSSWAKGISPVARPQTAHDVHEMLFFVDVPAAGFATGDILELAVQPPYSRLVNAKLITVGSLGAATVDIGIMSGQTGSLTNDDGSARTSGNELFAAAALTAEITSMTKAASLFLPKVDYERSIGVKFSAAVTAGAGKRIGVQLFFKQ